MSTEHIRSLLESVTTLTDYHKGLYVDIKNAHITGSGVSEPVRQGKFHYLNPIAQKRLTDILLQSPAEDLGAFIPISDREQQALAGSMWLQRAMSALDNERKKQEEILIQLQCVRENAIFEMERRSREQSFKSQTMEPMDPMTCRFLMGPTIIKDYKYFIKAKVPSGKEVAVKSLSFDIPDIYNNWLTVILKEKHASIKGFPYHYTAPTDVDQEVGKLYYSLGFKTKPTTEVYYKFPKGSTYSYSYGFRQGKSTKTKDLTPLE